MRVAFRGYSMTDAPSMTDDTAAPRSHSLAVITFWLASGAFAIGVSEFAAMSLLPYFAAEFGVTSSVAGHAISAYALGVVVGAPVIAVFASRFPRKYVLLVLMAVFALGNLLTAIAPSMWLMNTARFMSGLPHGAYLGIAMLFAADIAGKGKRAKAVSQVLLGIAIATVIGVPAASAISQILGWRVGFAIVTLLAFLTIAMIWRTAPYRGPFPNANPLAELGALKNRDVLLTLAMGAIGFGGMFAVYGYFSAAYLEATNAPEWGVSATLILFGLGGTIGNWASGLIASGRLLATAALFQIILGVGAGLYAAAVGDPIAMAAVLFFMGLGGGMCVPLQTRLMDVAGDAQTLAAAMNHAAFNFANAFGPWLAGLALAAGWGWGAPGLVGVMLSLGGLAIWLVMFLLERKQRLLQPACAC
tara:strand:- start:31253 stop:32503 length:1251 start_codon:yes stop_codon:yes gene_type:complete